MVKEIEAFKIAFSQYLKTVELQKMPSVALEIFLCLQTSRRSERQLIKSLNESRRANALLAKKNNELHYINESLNDENKRLRSEIESLKWQHPRLGNRIYGNAYATTRIPPDESRLA